MKVTEAIGLAKGWVAEIMKDEGLTNLGLEEVIFDEESRTWRITLGFSRPWNTVRNALTALGGEPAPRRAFRVVTIRDADGWILSMTKASDD